MGTGQAPCHILLVDDQRFFLALARDMLAPGGYRVETASSGPDALEMAQTSRPDAILLDVEMPGMDGYETCRRLKANPTTADIPVVFLTASLDPLVKQRALEAGGAGAFVKALSRDRLHGILRAIFTEARVPEIATGSVTARDRGRDG
jgi:CheY-like chemotaxis protein